MASEGNRCCSHWLINERCIQNLNHYSCEQHRSSWRWKRIGLNRHDFVVAAASDSCLQCSCRRLRQPLSLHVAWQPLPSNLICIESGVCREVIRRPFLSRLIDIANNIMPNVRKRAIEGKPHNIANNSSNSTHQHHRLPTSNLVRTWQSHQMAKPAWS